MNAPYTTSPTSIFYEIAQCQLNLVRRKIALTPAAFVLKGTRYGPGHLPVAGTRHG